MKNFFKKVAFVLALAMVLSNIGPAAKASAAEAPGLKYTSRVIYVGGSAFGDYTDNCWTPSKNTDGYKVTYEVTTGRDFITVASNGKIIATGNGIGKAVVRVTYTPEGAGQAFSANFTVKVRRNATDVRLTNATIALVEEALSVGSEIELNAGKSFVGTSYKKGNYGLNDFMKVVSDQITYVSSDVNEEVIKLEGNKLTAVGNGTATLSVVAYEYGDVTQTPVVYKDYTITVAGGILSAKQTHINKLELEMSQDADLDYSTFIITRGETRITVPLKEITSDGKKVVIETFYDMVKLDEMEKYEVKYTRIDEDRIVVESDIKDFEVTDGIVTNIGFNKDRIPYGTPTKIIALLKDSAGVILSECSYTEYVSGITKFEINLTDARGNMHGYTSGDDLVLEKVGNYADVEVIYERYSNNTNEKAVEIKGSIRIIATEQIPVDIEDLILTIKNGTDIDWSKDANRDICVKDENQYIHVLHKDSNDKDLTHEKGYVLTSSNSDILVVGGTILSFTSANNDANGIYADIFAVKEGTASVIVRDAEGKLISIVPVTVRAERRYSRFELDNTSFIVSNSNQIGTDHVKKVNIKFKDQYGDDLPSNPENEFFTLELLSKPANGTDIASVNGPYSGKSVDFDPRGAQPGTYTYRLSRGNISRTISINVRQPEPGGKITYELIRNGSLDLAYNNADSGSVSSVTYKVGIFKNGVLEQYASDVAVDLFTVNGISGLNEEESIAGKYTITGGVVTIHLRTTTSVTGGVLIQKANKGIYSIRIKEGAGSEFTFTFRDGLNVIDTQQNLMTAKVVNLSTSAVAGNSVDNLIKQACEFYYNGERKNNIEVIAIESTNFASDHVYVAGNQVYVKNVIVRYAVTDGVFVDFTVPVNRTITITN